MSNFIKINTNQPVLKDVTVQWNEATPAEIFQNVLEVQIADGSYVLSMTDESTIIFSAHNVKWLVIKGKQIINTPQNEIGESVDNLAAVQTQ